MPGEQATSPPVRHTLILASQSPRRKMLLTEAGYEFRVETPHPEAECGICGGESPAEFVAKNAVLKAQDVAQRIQPPADTVIIGCDTVAECQGQILGKPADEDHARKILETLRGREHRVLSGLCLWPGGGPEPIVVVEVTLLQMAPLGDAEIDEYLETGLWEGKAGAFGYQDRLGWVEITSGSESNVVGLPMERLAAELAKLA